MIKGIGPKTAETITRTFGKDTLAILDEEPERLIEVKGVGDAKVQTIKQAWLEQKAVREVILYLQSYDLPSSLAIRIYKKFGDQSITQIKKDPYELCESVHGIGFRTADRIALKMGLAAEHPRRMRAGLLHTLNFATREGDVFMLRSDLVNRSIQQLDVSEAAVESALKLMSDQMEVVITEIPEERDEAVYLPEFHEAETTVAQRLHHMQEKMAKPLLKPEHLQDKIRSMKGLHFELTEGQIKAIEASLINQISIITGGPGTGKTTIIRAIIQLLEEFSISYRLASPTGRAAKRMSEATGTPAMTIHRLLGFSASGSWTHDRFNPLLTDMIIVDEASMMDLQLAKALLEGIHPSTHLLFVGDVDQLPSVGAGDFLRDLIDSEVFPVISLDVIFRQEAGSTIIQNAHHIRRGEMPIFPEQVEDFFLFKIADDPERAQKLLVDVVSKRLPERFNCNPLEDIQVIVPMYRGEAGIVTLNNELQRVLNPPKRQKEMSIGDKLFREGDKLLQTSNDYEREIFNGDIGTILEINDEDSEVTIGFDDRPVTFEFSEMSDLMHAYAISVHRAQGSEYPIVVMPILTQHYVMLQRNLLYTAITRAKEKVVLIGSAKAIGIAIRNNPVTRRNSLLKSRLLS